MPNRRRFFRLAFALASAPMFFFAACAAPDSDEGRGSNVADERANQSGEKITQVSQCSAATFQEPCDPDGAGARTECEGECRLDTAGNATCVDIASLSPVPNMDDRLCGSLAATDCAHVCKAGVCAAAFAPNATPCQVNAASPICSGACTLGACVPIAVGCPTGRNKGLAPSDCKFATCDAANAALCVEVNLLAATSCSDGNACTTANETCDATGTCQPGTPKVCPGGGACALTTCDTLTGACGTTPGPNGIPCLDNTVCNGSETCQAGVCAAGVNLDCNDNNPCTVDACDAITGCSHVAVDCNDGNACTADVCNVLNGVCGHPPVLDNTPCADTNPCNGSETCQAGVCAPGSPLSCDDLDACTVDTCAPALGCQHGAVFCDDANPCTLDSCNSLSGCGATPLPDGTSCLDNTVCDGSEACAGGVCTNGAPLDCDDVDPCTTDTCDPTLGCSHAGICDGGSGASVSVSASVGATASASASASASAGVGGGGGAGGATSASVSVSASASAGAGGAGGASASVGVGGTGGTTVTVGAGGAGGSVSTSSTTGTGGAGGSASGTGGSASGTGGSASGTGGSASGTGGSASGTGGSAATTTSSATSAASATSGVGGSALNSADDGENGIAFQGGCHCELAGPSNGDGRAPSGTIPALALAGLAIALRRREKRAA